MNFKTGFKLITSMMLILIPTSIWAQNTDDAVRITDNMTGFGARALGMGGAYSAVADDYSAIYWNPAGLAQMRKTEFWMGLSNFKLNNDITFQNNPSTASNSATKFNSIGIAFPVPTYRGSLVFAFGYQRLKDFEYANQFRGISSAGTDRLSFVLDSTDNLYDFFNRPVQKQEYITDEGSINQWSIAGAMDVSPNMSVGASLNYWTGSSDYQLDFTQVDTFNNFNVFPADFNDYVENQTLLTKYSSFSLKLSGMFHAGRYARIGVGIDLPQTFSVKEDYRNSSSLSFDDGYVADFGTDNGTFEYNVKIPFRFSGGISASLGPALLTGSAKYTDWSQVKFAMPSNASLNDDYSSLLDQNKYFKTNYRGTLTLRFGGEVGIPFYDSQLRAGYIYDPNPLKNLSSDNDRKYFTFGGGVLLDRIIKLDLAYLRGTWKQTTYDNLAPSGSQEDITVQKLVLTVAYRF